MSATTGIKPNENLLEFFKSCKDGSIRAIKIKVKDEELTLDGSYPPEGSWSDDYDRIVLPSLEPKVPCYILYRLDSVNQLGYEWLYINWVPDFSPVRDKMLYAGTRAALRQEFGDGHILDTLHGTDEKDLSYEGYESHKRSKNAPPPLTMAEYELEEIKANEIKHTSLDSAEQTMTGLSFPWTDEGVNLVKQFAANQINYVQLKIDVQGERIYATSPAATMSVTQLPSNVSTEELGYHLFRWPHNFEGNHLESVIFIYSLSGYRSSIKERMLYSSCKGSIISALENVYKLVLSKKMETDSPSELTEANFMDALHPVKEDTKPKFSKPKGPGGARGPRRLIK